MRYREFIIKNYYYAGVNGATFKTDRGNYSAESKDIRMKGYNLRISMNLEFKTNIQELILYTDENTISIPGSWPRNDKIQYKGPHATTCYSCKSHRKLRQCEKCGKVQCKDCMDKKFTLSSIVKLPFTVATLGIVNTRKRACLHCGSTSIHKM